MGDPLVDRQMGEVGGEKEEGKEARTCKVNIHDGEQNLSKSVGSKVSVQLFGL